MSLFQSINLVYTDPEVQKLPSGEIPLDLGESSYEQYIREKEFMLSALSDVDKGYESILTILKNRAQMVGLSINNPKPSIKALFNNMPRSINFAQFIEILKYEKKLVASAATALANPLSYPTISEAVANTTFADSEAINAIRDLKIQFIEAGVDSENPDLVLSAMMAINGQSSASSAQSSLSDTTINDTRPKSPDVSERVEQIYKDCVPCADRMLDKLTDQTLFGKPATILSITKGSAAEAIWNTYRQRVLAEIKQLSYLRDSILSTSVSESICHLLTTLLDGICIPDLNSLLALFTLEKSRVSEGIKNFCKLSVGSSTLILDAYGALTRPLIDIIISLLGRVADGVLSPIDCIVSSMDAQFNKINNLLTTSKISDSVNKDRDRIANGLYQFVSDTKSAAYSWDNKVRELLLESSKNWSLGFGAGEEALDLLSEFNKHLLWISLIQEILFYKNEIKKYGVSKLKGLSAEEIREYVCRGAYKAKPWIILDKTNSGSYSVVDTSITNNSIKDEIDTENLSDRENSNDYRPYLSYNSATNENNLWLSDREEELSSKHKEFYATLQRLNTTLAPETANLVIATLETSSCIAANGLAGYSQEQINAWIAATTIGD